jgi:transcriptional regulator with XRE-family HTH domain
MLRALRRQADLSQRELAQRSGVPQSTIARIESGAATDPRFRTVERIVAAAGATLDVVTVSSAAPADPHEGVFDEGGRRFPAHLDLRAVERPEHWSGAWWRHTYVGPLDAAPTRLPPWTYDLSRARRDRRRRRAAFVAGLDIVQDGAWRWTACTPGGAVIARLFAGEITLGDGDRAVMIFGFVVADAWRGWGVGRRLLVVLQDELVRVGIDQVQAVVDGVQGRDFLLACGFRRDVIQPVRLTMRLPRPAREPSP